MHTNKEAVLSPNHYAIPGMEIEIIDIINAYNLNGNRASIVRYVFRAGLKDKDKEIEDLSKIIEYAHYEIRRLQGMQISRTALEVEMRKSKEKETK